MKMMARRRLLTIGHSYVVGLNRRLAHELAKTGRWDVTAAAPARFRGDFGWHVARHEDGERSALEAVPVHFSRKVHTMFYGNRLAELLREPWDLVHCWEEPYIAAAAQVARHTPAKVPLVFATFQNINKRYPLPFSWIEKYTLARADAMIAFGHTVLEVLEARGFPSSRARVIPPGVDAARFAPNPEARAAVRAALGWSGDTPVVGFLGRFVPEKGVVPLTQMLDSIDLPWRALFVGSGPLEPVLRTWAARHGGRVVIESGVRHDDVPRWLNAMDVLCAPSVTTGKWREQFGRMLIEAFAAGVAVVASDSGEIPHVVDGAGVIVAEGDADAWRRSLRGLLADEGLRAEFARRGRQRALSTFDWEVVARQHSTFFDQVIDGTLERAVRRAG